MSEHIPHPCEAGSHLGNKRAGLEAGAKQERRDEEERLIRGLNLLCGTIAVLMVVAVSAAIIWALFEVS
ncbi:hypothetical protein [Streptomyces luteolus]|uniref:Uncharacterized protein n=1 Tax=Streptomyces luteolus TaxID=3043615 RepID=A0ABT6T8Z1_9ACTN|nr:hypothetical protein [Streptomyces sp. B-S-A12]MDI3424350.1 hypothetical protein [Streptomyces sp. B-S-A12]